MKKSPLAFSQSLYGIFRGFKSFSLAIGLLIFLPLLRYLFDLTDLTCAMIGTLSKCFCDFLYAIGHSSTTIFFSKTLENHDEIVVFLQFRSLECFRRTSSLVFDRIYRKFVIRMTKVESFFCSRCFVREKNHLDFEFVQEKSFRFWRHSKRSMR